MAGDREHKVVVIGCHDFHIGTEKAPEGGQFFDSLRFGAFCGVRMHQRLTNNSAKPASGPEYSVPATGCAGTKLTFLGRCGVISRTTEPLTEPTSETIAPAERCGPISFATGPQAPTGMHTMTRSAPSTAAALLSTTWSARPSSAMRRRVSGERAVATMNALRLARGPRAQLRSRSARSRSAPGD